MPKNDGFCIQIGNTFDSHEHADGRGSLDVNEVQKFAMKPIWALLCQTLGPFLRRKRSISKTIGTKVRIEDWGQADNGGGGYCGKGDGSLITNDGFCI